jgi:hypothetical protein
MDFSNINKDTTFNLVNVCLNLAITWACFEYGMGVLADVLLPMVFIALASMNKVSFSRGVFFSKEGNDLTQKLPKKFNAWITLSVIVTVIALFMDMVPFGEGLFASFVTILSSYFMFNQCPISIVASKDAWKHKKVVFGMVPAPQIKQNQRSQEYDIFSDSLAFSDQPNNKWYRPKHSKH